MLLDAAAVSLRSIVRTRRLLLSELSGVQVVNGRTGMLGPDREHLKFRLRTGEEVIFKELNAPIQTDDDKPTIVRRAADAINDRLV